MKYIIEIEDSAIGIRFRAGESVEDGGIAEVDSIAKELFDVLIQAHVLWLETLGMDLAQTEAHVKSKLAGATINQEQPCKTRTKH